jgi:hypothetical protein
MSRLRDLTGQRFGQLMVRHRVENAKNRNARWLCECACGRELIAHSTSLVSGQTSCGCLRNKKSRERLTTHGKIGTRAYNSYCKAKRRCTSPSDPAFPNYGGRGIRFLFTSFQQFFAELGECPPGMTLGRIDNDGHYEPGNVRWEKWLPQQNNRRNNHPVTAFGVTHNLTTWARMFGINSGTLWKRLKRGVPPEQALATIKLKPGIMWEMVFVPAEETNSKTGTWEWWAFPGGPAAIRDYRQSPNRPR